MIERRAVVIGAGIAGAKVALDLIDRGLAVDLLSEGSLHIGNSMAALGGLRLRPAAGEPSPDEPARAMFGAAHAIFARLTAMGVPFPPSSEHDEIAYAGRETARRIHEVLLEQLASKGDRLRMFPHWECVELIRDEAGRLGGVVAQARRSMEFRAFPSDAVVLATGGPSGLFSRRLGTTYASGAGLGQAARLGAAFTAPEELLFHPTAALGEGLVRPFGDALLREGARIRFSTEGARAVAESDPEGPTPDFAKKNALSRWLFEHPRRREGAHALLDLRHLGAQTLAFLAPEWVLAAGGLDAREAPLPFAPAVVGAAGGLSVDFGAEGPSERDLQTQAEGLFAVGQAAALPLDPDPPEGTDLLATLFGAERAAGGVAAFASTREPTRVEAPLSAAVERAGRDYEAILARTTGPSVRALRDELAELLWKAFALGEGKGELAGELERLGALQARAACDDRSTFANQTAPSIRRLGDQILYAKVMAFGLEHPGSRIVTTSSSEGAINLRVASGEGAERR